MNIFNNKKYLWLSLFSSLALFLVVVGSLVLRRYGLKNLVQIVGYPGIWAIIFAESGLFFGFFLPGDSLLVTTGLLASQKFFNIYLLLVVLPIAAIAGDSVGYWFGSKLGPRIFNQKSSKLFNKKHLNNAQKFYERYGGKTIVVARFIPFIRTFAPIVAGAASMRYLKFISYNILGGLLWTVGMLCVGYFLGTSVPNIGEHLIPVITAIVFISLLPGVFEYLRNRLSS